MLIAVSLTPSSIHHLAFLHFSLSVVWVLCFCACSFVFLHGVDFKAYLAAALWCCGFVRLWPWCWGPVVAHTFRSFPFFFHAIYIPLLLSYCPLGLWVLISIVRWFCISAIMQFTVLLVFGFVLSCFRGALAEVLGSYDFVSVLNTTIHS